ncbi:hypothetical protein ACVWXQ_009406 [Bradyrhizobium sp. S3.14.4]
MALKSQGDDAENGCDAAGQHHAEHEAEPRGVPVQRGDPRGCIGGDAHERRLTERHDAADAGQECKTDGDQRIDADIVHQRDAERTEHEGSHRETQHGEDGGKLNVEARHSSISSSECSEARDRQIRIGISSEKTMTSLSALLSKEAKLSRMPTPTAPIAAPG